MFWIKSDPFPPFSCGLSFIEREDSVGKRKPSNQSRNDVITGAADKRRQRAASHPFPSASEQDKTTGASSYPMNPTPGTSEGSSRTSAASGECGRRPMARRPAQLSGNGQNMSRETCRWLFFFSSSLFVFVFSGWSFRMDGRQNCSTARQRPDSWHERRHYLSKVFTQHSCRFSSLRALKGIPINVRIKSK